jgi:hypothetical protein
MQKFVSRLLPLFENRCLTTGLLVQFELTNVFIAAISRLAQHVRRYTFCAKHCYVHEQIMCRIHGCLEHLKRSNISHWRLVVSRRGYCIKTGGRSIVPRSEGYELNARFKSDGWANGEDVGAWTAWLQCCDVQCCDVQARRHWNNSFIDEDRATMTDSWAKGVGVQPNRYKLSSARRRVVDG